jgi:hypothetical protein
MKSLIKVFMEFLELPRFKVTRPDERSDKIGEDLQKHYRSDVGMLLYLIKYSRPDLSNGVRELSKCVWTRQSLILTEKWIEEHGILKKILNARSITQEFSSYHLFNIFEE